MILSNVAIHAAIDAGDIIITPEPWPRLPSLNAPKSPYDTTAVNLRLSEHLSIGDKKQPFNFDLRTGGLATLLQDTYRPKVIDEDGGYLLKPKCFVLGSTVEHIELPIREGHPVYAARVEGRSSFARCGLVIHFTAPTIHAGFKGTITFEIMNFGEIGITLSRDLAVGQLIFERVEGMPQRHDSQFQGQNTPSGTNKGK